MILPFGLTQAAMTAAEAEADPESVAAAARLRRRFPIELAGPALNQAGLRRRARTKFGDLAATMWFTRTGLEQATRPGVAAHHARRLVAAGARTVIDLGCGIGTDALAFAAAGLRVIAVERDEQTYEVAAANLDGRAEVVHGDAEDVITRFPVDTTTAVFLDPARRSERGRSWRVEDLSPSWEFVLEQLNRPGPVGVKLGPGFPVALIPDGVESEWLCDGRDTVEAALWSGSGAVPDRRSALVLPDHRLVGVSADVPAGPVRSAFYEPVGAVTRSGALAALAGELEATAVHPRLPYLTSDQLRTTPYATGFRVLETWPYRERELRAWVRSRDVGTLEILTRGLDLDPAELRRRLRPTGRQQATVAITPTVVGKQVLVLERTVGSVEP